MLRFQPSPVRILQLQKDVPYAPIEECRVALIENNDHIGDAVLSLHSDYRITRRYLLQQVSK